MRDFIFGILGGTAMLMYGVDMMGEGLERLSGNMMKKVLQKKSIFTTASFYLGKQQAMHSCKLWVSSCSK